MGTRAIRSALGLICAIALGAGCGKGSGGKAKGSGDDGRPTEQAETAATALPPLDPLPLGLEGLTAFAYSTKGDARKRFGEISAAEEEGRWKDAEAVCRELLERDPGHLEAQWHLGSALARQGRFEDAVGPLSVAVAGDFMRWGDRSRRARALRGFNASPQGPRFARLVELHRDEFQRAISDALLVVGRRGKPWPARSTGATTLNHRSEIYALVLETKRFLRVSRTNGSLVGFVRSRFANQLGFVSYRRVWVPDEEQAAAGAQPYLRRVRVGAIDLGDARMSLREVTFEDVLWIEIFYADQAKQAPRLLARVRPVEPARGERLVQTYEIDAERGEAKLVEPMSPRAEVLRVGYDTVAMRRPRVEGVTADWGAEGSAGALRLERTRKTITMPAGEFAARDSMIWSPSGSRLAFATAATDPCSEEAAERAVALYVAEAATGKLRRLTAGEGAFAPVWLDDERLAYVDRSSGEPGVRLIDVTSEEVHADLTTPGGMGTDWLPAGTRCAGVAFDDVDRSSPDEEVFFEEEDEDQDDDSPDDVAGAGDEARKKR